MFNYSLYHTMGINKVLLFMIAQSYHVYSHAESTANSIKTQTQNDPES